MPITAQALNGVISDSHYNCLFTQRGGARTQHEDGGFYHHVALAGEHIFRAACEADEHNMNSMTAAFGAHFKAFMQVLYSHVGTQTAYHLAGLLLLGYPADMLLKTLRPGSQIGTR